MIWGLRQGMPHRPHSSSASRLTAGASGFFILSQSGERPERVGRVLSCLSITCPASSMRKPPCCSRVRRTSLAQ
jgi:hypothetical protein